MSRWENSLEKGEDASVRDNKDAQVVAHLPMRARLKYAQLYDEFHNTNAVKQALGSAWAKVVPFEVPGPLTLEDRRQLHALINAARADDNTMASNLPVAQKLAASLGIKPEYPPEAPNLAAQIPPSKSAGRSSETEVCVSISGQQLSASNV